MGGFIQEFVGGMMTLVVYGMIFAGVYKVFQISTDLNELKDLLRDIRRNTDSQLSPVAAAKSNQPATQVPLPAAGQSPEDLLRALREQNYSLDYAEDHPQPATPSLGDSPR